MEEDDSGLLFLPPKHHTFILFTPLRWPYYDLFFTDISSHKDKFISIFFPMSGSLSQGGVAPQRGTTQDTPLMELNLGEENKEEGERRKNRQKKHYVMAGIGTHKLCL